MMHNPRLSLPTRGVWDWDWDYIQTSKNVLIKMNDYLTPKNYSCCRTMVHQHSVINYENIKLNNMIDSHHISIKEALE